MAEIKSQASSRIRTFYDDKAVLEEFRREMLIDLNCHAIGTIQSFDPATQRVNVSVNYKKTFLLSNGKANGEGIVQYENKFVDYPIIADMPIYVMHGGDFFLQMPIQKGDACSILFNDRDLDNWLISGQSSPLASNRLHAFSDGIALIGLRPFTKPFAEYDMTHALLRNLETKLGISAGKILATNAAGKTLNDLLQELIDAIKNISVSAGTFTNSGGPVTGAGVISPGSQSSLNAVASDIGDLLE